MAHPLPAELLNSMLQVGLSDELLGRAVRELLLAQQASVPGEPTQTRRGAALQVPEQQTGPAKETPMPAPAEFPIAVTSDAPRAAQPSALPRNDLVPLKVRFPEGGATNVVVTRQMLELLAKAEGSDEAARAWVRAAAQAAPPETHNRSRWVQERISEHVIEKKSTKH